MASNIKWKLLGCLVDLIKTPRQFKHVSSAYLNLAESSTKKTPSLFLIILIAIFVIS